MTSPAIPILLPPTCESGPIFGRAAPHDHDDVVTSIDLEVTRVESFEDYYQRDYRSLVGLAFVLTGSQWAAEDLVQDALTTAHRKWDTVSGYDRPDAWVRRVMVNRSTSRFRKLKTESKTLVKLRALREPTISPSERTDEIWNAVRQLPPRQAQAIALYYWDDMSLAQIANVLDCGTETVKTHLARGRARLGDLLESHAPLSEGLADE